jgi:hypothetical protein
MSIEKLIKKKIDNCNHKLVLIEKTVNTEMALTIYERNNNLLDFLHKEKAVYNFLLIELTDLQDNLYEESK